VWLILYKNTLEEFGFNFGKNSMHTRRTNMFNELEILLSSVPNAISTNEYLKAIIDENCLGKRTHNSRVYTSQYLIQLYTLNPEIPLFKAMLYFWKREPEARPLLALLCSASRDLLLRSTFKVIIETPETVVLTRETMEEYVEALYPERFSKATLKSVAQNLNSTWTKSGHLNGKTKKIRTKANTTPAAVAYALYISYLQGTRGTELFETEYLKMMDCSKEKAIELAEIASSRGWIVFKRIGNVIEALFPNLLSKVEVNR
jgi:hypothetical protein